MCVFVNQLTTNISSAFGLILFKLLFHGPKKPASSVDAYNSKAIPVDTHTSYRRLLELCNNDRPAGVYTSFRNIKLLIDLCLMELQERKTKDITPSAIHMAAYDGMPFDIQEVLNCSVRMDEKATTHSLTALHISTLVCIQMASKREEVISSLYYGTDRVVVTAIPEKEMQAFDLVLNAMLQSDAEDDEADSQSTGKALTPLYLAAEVCEVWCRKDVMWVMSGMPCLMFIPQSGVLSLVDKLQDTKYTPCDGGKTPLHIAVENQHEKIVERLTQDKATKDKLDEQKRKPAYIAQLLPNKAIKQLVMDDDSTAPDSGKRLIGLGQSAPLEVVSRGQKQKRM